MVCKCLQYSSVAQSCPTLCNPMDCSMPGLSVNHQLPEFTQLMPTELVMPSNHPILCRPLLLPPSIFASIRIFSESALRIRWPKYWSFAGVQPRWIQGDSKVGMESESLEKYIFNQRYREIRYGSCSRNISVEKEA